MNSHLALLSAQKATETRARTVKKKINKSSFLFLPHALSKGQEAAAEVT